MDFFVRCPTSLCNQPLIKKNKEPVQWGKVALCYRRPKVAALFGVAAAEGDKHEIILSAILKVMLCAGIYI